MNRLFKPLLITIAFLICTGAAWGQDWGGTTLRSAANMDYTYIRAAPYADTNFGAALASTVINGVGAAEESNLLVRMTADPHTGGYTQDICTLFIYITASTDSGMIRGYVLQRDWGEGAGNNQTAQAGECSWNAALEGTTDWTTAGAQSTASDRQATPACSLYLPAAASKPAYFALEIAGTHLTQDFFDYGIVLTNDGLGGNYAVIQVISDDNGVEANRPYFNGYESPGAAGTPLSVGAAKLGATKLASPQ